MQCLKFTLKGRFAFFKQPEVNTFYYFSYGHIHKVALMGIFGAILGYSGYESIVKSQQDYDVFPQFYEKLKEIQVSIVPKAKQGIFRKKVQSFNNSVGYASQEAGGNLIIKEEWLENPEWTIYVLLDNEESQKIASSITENRCIYYPYLGKNDHLATICDSEIIELEEKDPEECQVHSLCPAKLVTFDFDEMEYRYGEYLPVGLKSSTNHYELEMFYLTDALVEDSKEPLYTDGKLNIMFY